MASELTPQEYRTIFEGAGISIVQANADGRIVHTNSMFAQMLGYQPGALDGLSWQDLTHPDDVAENLQLFRDLLACRHDHYCMEKRYLAKPADAEQLYRPLERWSPGPEPGPPPANLAQVLAAAEHSTDLFGTLRTTFLESYPEKLWELSRAVAAGDGPKAAFAAHALRGSTVIFRAKPASELAAEIESLAGQSRLEAVPALVEELKRELSRLAEFLLAAS